VNGLLGVIVIIAVAVWLIRPQILKWRQRRKLREFEQEQRRKWEQHRRE
jgi:hypothetical protein